MMLPLSPIEGYSHTHLANLVGYNAVQSRIPDEVRFYCRTSNHPRVINFKTRNQHIRNVAFSGQHNMLNRPEHWSQNWTALTGHTGYLPDATTNAYSNSMNPGNLHSVSAAGFIDLPFFRW
eukprot:6483761-Pyramimonas_sp.AAC.1